MKRQVNKLLLQLSHFRINDFICNERAYSYCRCHDRIPSYVESTHRLNGVESDSVLHDETDLHGEKDYIEPKHVDIELNHVSYSYPDSNEIVLKDVSLQIKAGKKIAILGEVGQGNLLY